MSTESSYFKKVKETLTETQEEKLVERLSGSPGEATGVEEKEEHVRQVQDNLESLNAETLALEAGICETGGEIQGNLGNRVETIHQLAEDCYQRLDLERQKNGEAWKKYKEETENLLENLEQAIEETSRKFVR
jgi:hypothetical protein